MNLLLHNNLIKSENQFYTDAFISKILKTGINAKLHR